MKAIKWLFFVLGGLIVLIIVALLVIPMFVDVEKYKPEIEKKISEATGRPFNIRGNLDLSLFPWAGISFSDLHMGNPPGFKEKDFASVKFFEARVKLLPLITKDIQVKRFILEGPRIVLEKDKSGRTNWEGLGKPSAKPQEEKPGDKLPIKSLGVGEFAIKKGALLWIDDTKGERKEIKDINLTLENVSLDRPIQLALSADVDGQPLELKGNLGPIGKEPGKGTLPLNFSLKALKELGVHLKGKIIEPTSRQEFDLAVKVSPFSPRKLLKELGKDFPIKTADPAALNSVALSANIKGDPMRVSISEGVLELDQSKLSFSAQAKDFSKPDLAFNLNLDKIDLDRYLPPHGEKETDKAKEKAKAPTSEKKRADYSGLRKLILDGSVRIGELKAHGAKIQELTLKVVGKNGTLRLNPLTMKLYQGDVSSKASLDVRQDTPKTQLTLEAKGIQVKPLLNDVLKKDFLEGTARINLDITMEGDDPEKIKPTLNGKGDFLFNNGAIRGIGLADMVRNVKVAFGLAGEGGKKPRTDFSKLHSPFTITNGVVNTPGTTLSSPLVRVLAKGKADLVKETLDFRIEPKFMGRIRGQGDTAQRSGITVPILVTGSFSSPQFTPDLKAVVQDTLEKAIKEPEALKGLLPGKGRQEGDAGRMAEKVRDFLRRLPLGR